MKKPKPLRERLSATLLAQLKKRKITNLEAAEKLGVSETYLSRTVASIQDKEPGKVIPARNAAAKITKVRREVRNSWARKVVAKNSKVTLAEAAAQAGCSERTMFRYVAQYRR